MNEHASGLSGHAMAAIARVRRAAAAERTLAISVSVEIRPLASLSDIVEPWKALAAHALEPNVFLEPAFALAAAPVLGADVRAGLIWSQSAIPELLGVFPVRIEPRRYGLPLPVLSAWTHPFAPFGTPLIHRDAAEAVIVAWLDHLSRDRSLPALLLMPYIRDDAPFAALLDGALARRGNPMETYDRHQRALLAPEADRASYLDRAIAPKQRKELARKWRRMQDLGPTVITQIEDPAAVAAALDDFFHLEAGGWKGRAGTAAATNTAIRTFMTQAVLDLAARKQAMLHRLSIADKPIAVCIAFRSGHSAWGWKVAYDEDYARFSPGVQLLVEVTSELLRDGSIVQADSLAHPNHPLIDHVWRERCTLSDRLIGVRPDTFVPFAFVCRLEAMRRLGRSAARAMLDHLRRR